MRRRFWQSLAGALRGRRWRERRHHRPGALNLRPPAPPVHRSPESMPEGLSPIEVGSGQSTETGRRRAALPARVPGRPPRLDGHRPAPPPPCPPDPEPVQPDSPRPGVYSCAGTGSAWLVASGGGRRVVRCVGRFAGPPCGIRTWSPPSGHRAGRRHRVGAAAAVSMACRSLASSASISPIATRSRGLMNPSLRRKPPARAMASRSGTAQ